MNIGDVIATPIMAVTPDKEIEYSPLHQFGLGLLGAGIPMGVGRLLGKSWLSTIPAAVGGLAVGLSTLPLHNALVQYKKNRQEEEAKEAIQEFLTPKIDTGKNIQNIGDKLVSIHGHLTRNPDLSKQAGYISKGLGMASKGVFEVGKAVGKGLLPTPKKAPIGEKIFGVAMKGSAIAGTVAATGAGIGLMKKKQNYNYNTHLRNNILHGAIKPSELNSGELQEVKNLGWQ